MKFDVDFEAGSAKVSMMGATAPIGMNVLLENAATAAVFETGIIPQQGSGLISLRKGFGRLQFVYQIEPQVHTVKWDKYESTTDKKTYQLAEPWKIIISDYDNGNFLGSRHFYSPEPILSYNQPLYVINLPNTNTVGYSGNSIGWICHYHYDNTTQFSISEMINYAVYRESGLNEPYNDANMSETDGPRFYSGRGAPEFIWDPVEWAKKTAEEGVDWTLDPSLWQVVKIDWNKTKSAESFDDNGEIYTLSDAVFKPYYAYYPHRKAQPFEIPLNIYRRLLNEGKNPWESKELLSELGQRWRVSNFQVNNKYNAAAANSSPQDLFNSLKKLKVANLSDLQNKFISDGELCQNPTCNKKIKPSQGTLVQVVTKLVNSVNSKIRTTQEYLMCLSQSTRSLWCETCVDNHAVKLGKILDYSFPGLVSTELVDYSVITQEYYLKATVLTCSKCKATEAPVDRAHEIFFYSPEILNDPEFKVASNNYTTVPDNPRNTCCTFCAELVALSNMWDSYDITSSNWLCKIRFIDKDLNALSVSHGDVNPNAVFYKFKLLDFNVKGDTAITWANIDKLELEYETELVPIVLANQTGISICPCNMPTYESGENPCQKCVNNKGEYVPLIETIINTNNMTVKDNTNV